MDVPENELDKRPADDIAYAIIHHSVTPNNVDIANIAAMEKKSFGFVTVGYHALIRKQGADWIIQEGRSLDDVPAAALGLNEASYDICIEGNYEVDAIDPRALDVLLARIEAVKKKCPNLRYLIGHRDVAGIKQKQDLISAGEASSRYGTACPGKNLYAVLPDVRKKSGLGLPPELPADKAPNNEKAPA